jgi:hypothetical protein
MDDDFKRSAHKKYLGPVILLLSILGGSSIGVMNNYVPVPSPFAKNAWRNGLNCVYFSIPALVGYLQNPTLKLDGMTYARMVFTMIFQVIWVFGLTFASQRTIQSHAYLMNNVHGLFIVAINFILGYKILIGECRGVILALAGCIFILYDP